MDKNTDMKRFEQAIDDLKYGWSNIVKPEMRRPYLMALEDLPIDKIEAAVVRAVRQLDKCPSPHDFRVMVCDSSKPVQTYDQQEYRPQGPVQLAHHIWYRDILEKMRSLSQEARYRVDVLTDQHIRSGFDPETATVQAYGDYLLESQPEQLPQTIADLAGYSGPTSYADATGRGE